MDSMENTGFIELTLSDGSTARLNIVHIEEVSVSKNEKGEWVDKDGNVVVLD